MKYIILFLFVLLSCNIHAENDDIFINQIRMKHKNCHVEYWCNNPGKFTDNWTELHFSVCGDWTRAIFYKYNLVIEGHYVGLDMCDWYSEKYKCFVINSYHVPIKVIGLNCTGE